ncbi:hypothetical protein [Actinoallomurus iriomotensis]|uniref:Uncharacterized protein n=1 Tax=Actinoallomurus iriomotensis TaxID=478107 RepID=A0A9W6RCG3_9ACTN|nr:hypothetical protein [Actinoallomurus iriomotensis]GLY73441.1 hypothetical protein Airi01_017080 [Actinoallomurus iriomotensis]
MWHGDPGFGRRRAGRTETDRSVDARRARRAHDNTADSRARRFTEGLEDALSGLGGGCFEHAGHKADHVEELRRVLGLLLDVLADWEMLAARPGERLE